MSNLNSIIFSRVQKLLNESSNHTLTVFHGTKEKFVEDIQRNGLINPSGNYNQGWYVVSTDIESALFHAYAEENSFAFVFEFEIPLKENHFWEGYPYLWKGEKRGSNSTWFAQMKPIPKEYIKKIHQISYKDWISQKNHGF
jgi:hypothetical protein